VFATILEVVGQSSYKVIDEYNTVWSGNIWSGTATNFVKVNSNHSFTERNKLYYRLKK
jgi:hypothetical protein